jgi:hypothetical protein
MGGTANGVGEMEGKPSFPWSVSNSYTSATQSLASLCTDCAISSRYNWHAEGKFRTKEMRAWHRAKPVIAALSVNLL